MSLHQIKNSLFIMTLIASSQAWCWGSRGHHLVCSSAVYLLKNESLKNFMLGRGDMMGHLCDVPDIYWKSLGNDVRKVENPSHFINGDLLDVSYDQVSENYQDVIKQYTGFQSALKEKPIQSVPEELGSLWWRAGQFFDRAFSFASVAQQSPIPASKNDERNEQYPYNKAVFDMMTNMGLMGHYVGDASMPLHSSYDYDGYADGHGGIHFFYEDSVVNELSPEIIGEIVKKAKSHGKEKFMNSTSVIAAMKELTVTAQSEKALMYKLDVMTKPSEIKQEKGMQLRTPAERPEARLVAQKFKPLIVLQLSRSAALLAKSWDDFYQKANSPDLTKYKSFAYPITPAYVAPDYQ